MTIATEELSSEQKDEKTPLDIFKDDLQEMVLSTEDGGESALSALLAMRNDLRTATGDMIRQSLAIEQNWLPDRDNSTAKLAEWTRLQEELVLNAHKQKWLDGYIRDRQPPREFPDIDRRQQASL